ncbi:MAG TPA: hypothetical protein VI814_12365 [Candidatus Limnocylindria bacterium]
MVDLIHRFARTIRDAEGRTYVAEAHGRAAPTGLWEGWLEFVGVGRGIVLRTMTETRQPTRRGLVYWASGLQPTYLEGALTRAMRARLEAFRDEVA